MTTIINTDAAIISELKKARETTVILDVGLLEDSDAWIELNQVLLKEGISITLLQAKRRLNAKSAADMRLRNFLSDHCIASIWPKV